MKKDLRCNKNIYGNWKNKVSIDGETDISKENSKLLLDYVFDMEIGMNVSSKVAKKGGRGEGRLNVIRRRMKQIMHYFESININPITTVTEKQAMEWSNALYRGQIKRIDGEDYEAPKEFIVQFKAFWRWLIKSNKKLGIKTEDIIEDLPLNKKENRFCYISKEQIFEEVIPEINKINLDYGMLLGFLVDSIIRFPTEVASLSEEFIQKREHGLWVNIPKEISKTYERQYNLLYVSDILMQYLEDKKKNRNTKEDKRIKKKNDDNVFSFLRSENEVYKFNTALKEVVIKLYCEKETKIYSKLTEDEKKEKGYIIFVNGKMLRTSRKKYPNLNNITVDVYKDKMSHPVAQGFYSEISGYDARHIGGIHLRKLANKNGKISLDAIRTRGGWVDFDMLNYYTKFLGLTGEISKEDILFEEDKSRMEKDLAEQDNKIKAMEKQMQSQAQEFQKQLQELAGLISGSKEVYKHPEAVVFHDGKKEGIEWVEE